MPTPFDKEWEDLTDHQKANLKPHEHLLYLEAREEDFLEMARETMEDEIDTARRRLEKKKAKKSEPS